MRDEDKTVYGCLGALAYTAVALPLSSIFRGFVIAKLWAWFVSAPFGIRPIGIALAIGLSTLIGLCTYQYEDNEGKKGTVERLVDATLMAILLPSICLLIGWIAKQAM